MSKMLEVFLRKHITLVSNRFIFVTFKLSYCDFSLIKSKPNLKSLVESDFSRVSKKPFEKNFVENLFVNKFEPKVFQYPQLDTLEEVERLKSYCDFAQKLITSEISSDNAEVGSKQAVLTVREHELTGFKIPRVKNGFGFLSSEYSRMQEALGVNPSLAKTVSENDDFGIQLIDSFGNDVQKEQYLKKLISGKIISSCAHAEVGSSLIGDSGVNTSAVLSSDGEKYLISGTKTWVYNANLADLFILSAHIKGCNVKNVCKPTLFIVNRNTPGVVIHEPIKTVGMKNLNICDITFNEVVVPVSSILGKINEGDDMIKIVLSKGKLNNGGQCLAIMKEFVNRSIKHCIHNEFFDKDKNDIDHFKIKIGQMVAKIYVVESMTYFLTGRLDSFTDAEVFLESLIIKIFASEALQFVIKEATEILGDKMFTSDENLIELIKDSHFFTACDDTNNYLRLVLSSAGLKYAMSYKANPFEKISKLLKSIKVSKTNKNLSYFPSGKFEGYLHLMFHKECWILENSVFILDTCTRYLIKSFGENVFHKCLQLTCLANIAVNIYAMAATLGRASRAYCLGLRFHDVDRLSTEIEIRKLFFLIQEAKTVIYNPDAFSSCSQISLSIMNGNKYSYPYPVMKNLTAQKSVKE